jgi:hypothetical protein
MNEVCFRRLRLFPPRFRDLARPQNRLNNVNTVCFRRLRLFLLIPGSCDLTIDDVNKFCFRRLRFLPRFWEPGETAGIGPRLPGVIAGGNVGGRGLGGGPGPRVAGECARGSSDFERGQVGYILCTTVVGRV